MRKSTNNFGVGSLGETEMKAIRSICSSLDARFYDAELADFIAL